ncbi:MAG: hypothetical protein V4603_14465 [Pseudomonadota bacterium]
MISALPKTAWLRAILLLGLLWTTVPVNAAETDYMDMITRYVGRLNNIYDGTWAYTFTTTDKRKDEVRVRRVDPSKADYRERDILLTVNGEPPTAKRLSQHLRQMEKRESRRKRNGARAHEDPSRPNEKPGKEKDRFLAALIPDSIHEIKREGDLLHLGFKATEPGREGIFEKLDGTLVLDTRDEYIKELQLRPTGPFYPFFLTKVEDALLVVHFGLVNGEPVQQSATWKLLGQALIVKNLDADMEVVWEQFEKVTPAVPL